MYSVQCAVCSVQCVTVVFLVAVCHVYWSVYMVQCAMCIVSLAAYGLTCVLSSLWIMHCAVWYAQWGTVHCELYTVHCAALCTVHCALCTVQHCALCIVHCALCSPVQPAPIVPPCSSLWSPCHQMAPASASDFTQTLPCCFIHRAALRYISLHCTLHSSYSREQSRIQTS